MMYVTRRRNRVLRRMNPVPLDPAKSNPSKRHRERLNGELEHLAGLLPFEDSVIAKLDKLSVLRLAVSYLRAKSYYKAIKPGASSPYPSLPANADSVLKALSGFVMVIDPRGEVFYVSETVEQYLGFHQSDILHQSVLELVHSEDRESLAQQLSWSHLNIHSYDVSSNNQYLMQRSFIVRFRCLLDNTSGFITMEISGNLRPLYGQKSMTGLGLFGMCTPFGPIPIGDSNLEDITFRTKHKLDMTIVSVDSRGKILLGDLEQENSKTNMYSLIHPLDAKYLADAHSEMLKTGSAGLVAYRVSGKEGNWLWLQTSARVVYRNGKPDYLMFFHRSLTEEEGSNLIGKRNIEFAMPHLHNEPLIDDQGDYIDDLPKTTKVRKSKKIAAVPVADAVSYEQPSMTYNKDTQASLYYQFHGFQQNGYHPSMYNTQFYDAYLANDTQSRNPYYFDYLNYQPSQVQPTHVLPMDTERFTSALAMYPTMSGYPSNFNYGPHPSTHVPQYHPSRDTTTHDSQSYHTISPPHIHGYVTTSSAAVLPNPKTVGLMSDINSNALNPFSEMAYPLLSTCTQ